MFKLITCNFKSNLLSTSYLMCSNSLKCNKKYYFQWISKPKYIPYNQLLKQPLSVQSMETLRSIHEDEGLIKKMIRKLKFNLYLRRWILLNSHKLYSKIDMSIDYEKFFDVCGMPDTFYSWYLVMELHIWMVSARVMADEEKGKHVRNFLIESLWMDIELRAKELEGANVTARRKQIKILKEHYTFSFIAYDEALNGDDKVLASALWRTLLMKNCEDPERIECCVNYVRKNLAHIDAIIFDEMMLNTEISFLPLWEPNQLKNLN